MMTPSRPRDQRGEYSGPLWQVRDVGGWRARRTGPWQHLKKGSHLQIILLLSCCISSAPAQEPGAPALELLDGAHQAGWMVAAGRVVMGEDEAVLERGARFVYTDFSFGDYTATLKYQLRGDVCGRPIIYYRARLGSQSGRVCGHFLSVGTRHASRFPSRAARSRRSPRGAWHELSIEVTGDRGLATIDGRWTTRLAGIPAAPGLIALGLDRSCNGSVAFQGLTVVEHNYTPLFDGQSLHHWQGAGADASKCWKARDGLLWCTGQKGPWLRSVQEFDDFNLRLEYRLKEGGNSGVYVRVPSDGRHHGKGAGVEIQILDDSSPRYAKLKPYQMAGSIYAVAPAQLHTGRPAGQWNALEINCRGRRYTITQNGVVVLDATEQQFPELSERLVKGFLGLQNHSETVWFRQLRIGPAR